MTEQWKLDRKLLDRMLDGDEEAFSHFVDDYYPKVYRFAFSRVGNDPDAAQDVVQGTFEKLMPQLDRFRGESSLLTWICAFCRYEIAAYWRSVNKHSQEVELTENSPDVRAGLERLAAADGGPVAELERKDVARQVRETLDDLPTHYSNALQWKYKCGLSVREIAVRLDSSPKAAESILTRARQAFRDGFTAVVGEYVR